MRSLNENDPHMHHVSAYVAHCLLEKKQPLARVRKNVELLSRLASRQRPSLWSRAVFHHTDADDGATVFMRAASCAEAWALHGEALLADRGCDLFATDTIKRSTVLDHAVARGNVQAARRILEVCEAWHGRRRTLDGLVHHRNDDGDYPLCWAVYRGDDRSIALLLAQQHGGRILSAKGITNALSIPAVCGAGPLDALLDDLEAPGKYAPAEIAALLGDPTTCGYSVVYVLENHGAPGLLASAWRARLLLFKASMTRSPRAV